jgi:hypothetical protein
MSDLPYTRSQIVAAGKLLRGRVQLSDEAREAFRIAHAWRSAHVEPMHRLRQQLAGRARGTGSITAARLKRMESIRRKLARGPHTLLQMQDLAGCRVIVPTMEEVARLVDRYRSDPLHYALSREQDHITRAKPDGYRSHHMILKPTLPDREAGRQQIEIQSRTRLQHAWATAVEAVGLVRGENLKGGDGDATWRRFFRLASADVALAEGCEAGEGAPASQREITIELRDLAAQLDAVRTLQNYNLAISQAIVQPRLGDRYFLIEYRTASRSIRVTPYATLPSGQLELERGDSDSVSTVVVEVDQLEDLKTAYPNYFLDLSLFIDHLRVALDPSLRRSSLSLRHADDARSAASGANADPGGWRPNLDWLRDRTWRRR